MIILKVAIYVPGPNTQAMKFFHVIKKWLHIVNLELVLREKIINFLITIGLEVYVMKSLSSMTTIEQKNIALEVKKLII